MTVCAEEYYVTDDTSGIGISIVGMRLVLAQCLPLASFSNCILCVLPIADPDRFCNQSGGSSAYNTAPIVLFISLISYFACTV